MTAQALPGIADLVEGVVAEFDLDIRWGELEAAGEPLGYMPTLDEVPGETCNSEQPTCPHTCAATCPGTCHHSCGGTCLIACNPTFAQTHCPSCADPHCI